MFEKLFEIPFCHHFRNWKVIINGHSLCLGVTELPILPYLWFNTSHPQRALPWCFHQVWKLDIIRIMCIRNLNHWNVAFLQGHLIDLRQSSNGIGSYQIPKSWGCQGLQGGQGQISTAGENQIRTIACDRDSEPYWCFCWNHCSFLFFSPFGLCRFLFLCDLLLNTPLLWLCNLSLLKKVLLENTANSD